MTIHVSEELDAPVDVVWSYIGDFGGLARWHPGVRSCEVQGSGIGALRVVGLDGWHAVERLTVYDPARHVLGYEMIDCGRAVLIGVRGLMELSALPGNRCRIDWSSRLPDNPSPELEPLLQAYYPARIAQLRAALANR